jgi:hypothetical protein
MNRNLYFLPIITKALKEANPKAALKCAFDEIKQLGKQKQYREGFSNFRHFMEQVRSYRELQETDFVNQLVAEIATDTFDGSEEEKQAVVKSIISHPEFKAEYEATCQEIEKEIGKQATAIIQVLSKRRLVGEMTFTKIPDRKSIEGIFPGSYMLKLNIGRVIWQGDLMRKDLIWSEAFEGKPLDLAAETTEIKRKPTREIILFGGDVILRIFASIESGSIEVELTK